MRKTKKTLAILAIVAMVFTMIPMQLFAATATTYDRIGGQTQYDTAALIAKAEFPSGTSTAIIAVGTVGNSYDALAAGPLAVKKNAPILLTEGTQLTAVTKTTLQSLGVKNAIIVGGTGVVKQGVEDSIKALGISTSRLAGFDAAETSVKVAQAIGSSSTIVLAGGRGQDALSVAPIAAAKGYPILYTDKASNLPDTVANYVSGLSGVSTSYVIGGVGVITDAEALQLPGTKVRYGGYDAYDTNLAVIQGLVSSISFGKVYVANGQTMVDALAGAPLAAATNSAIVLTDNVKIPAAQFVSSQLSASSEAIALGGTAAVSDSILHQISYTAPVADNPKITAVTSPDANTLVVSFDKAVVNSAAQPAAVSVKQGSTAVDYASITWTADQQTLTIKTKAPLATSTAYAISVTPVNRDAITYTFTTPASYVVDPTKITATVSADAKTVTVNFDNAVADTTKAVFTVTKGTDTVAQTSVFSTDKKVATLTFATALAAGDYTVSVSGAAAAALTATFNVAAPVPTKITVAKGADDKTVTATFDNAVADTSKAVFTVKKGDTVVAQTAAFDADKKVATLTFDTALTAGDYTVSVSGVAEADLTATYTVSAPLAIDFVSAVTNSKINVVLKDAVTSVTADQFTIEGLTVSSATLSADGQIVTLVTSAQTAGQSYTVKAGDTSANWIALVADTVKPAVTSATAVTNNLVQVTFAEQDATAASILNPANYVFDNGLTAQTVAYVVGANGKVNKDKVYVTTSAQTAGTVYTLTVSNVEDESGNKIDNTVKFQFAGKSADKNAPTLTIATSTKGNTVNLTFNDESQLDNATLSDPANYSISGGLTVTAVEVTSNPITSGNKTVKLTTSNQTPGTVYTVTVKGIKDVFGNTPSSDLTAQFAGTSLDTTPPDVTLATAASNVKVKVVFNDTLDEASATDIANYSIPGLTVTAAALDKDSSSSTYLQAVTLTTTAQTAGTVYTVTVTNVKDSSGNAITTSQTYKADFAGKSADTTAPTVTSVQALAGNKVQIVFSDASALDETTVKTLTNYSFDGSLGYPTSVVSWSATTKTLVLSTAAQTNGQVYNVTINNIKDEAGNAITANTKLPFAGIGNALDALKLDSVVALNNVQILVKFNKDVDNGTVQLTDFQYKQGSGAYGAVPGTLYKVDSKTYIISLPTVNKLVSDIYGLKVNSEIKDLGGVALNLSDSSVAEKTFGGVTSDPVAPKVQTVTQVSANTVEVVFDNAVAVAGLLPADVTVAYDAITPIQLSSASVDSTDAHKVRFTFASPFASGKVATLSFKTSAFTKITDITGQIPLSTASASLDKAFGTLDFTATTLKLTSAVSIDAQTLELTFNQDIVFNTNGSRVTLSGADDDFLKILDAANVQVTGYDLKSAIQTAPNKVRVYFTAGTNIAEGNLYKVAITHNAAGDELFVLADGSGTKLDASTAANATASFGYNSAAVAKPSLVSVTPLSGNVVQLTFSQPLSDTPVLGTDISFLNGSTNIDAGIALTPLDSTNKVFLATLTGGNFLAGTTYTVKTLASSTITDANLVSGLKKSSADDSTKVTVTFGGVAAAPAGFTITNPLVSGTAQDGITFTDNATTTEDQIAFAASSFAATDTVTIKVGAASAITLTVAGDGSVTATNIGDNTGVANVTAVLTITDTAGNQRVQNIILQGTGATLL